MRPTLSLEPISGFQVTGILTLDRPRVCGWCSRAVIMSGIYSSGTFRVIGFMISFRALSPDFWGERSLNAVHGAVKAEKQERQRMKQAPKVVRWRQS
jgi:hypothetical protein